jgi:ectoine hydroxylase-related dioxygenase (phytanoyl-CoA dioxygenase family)
MAPIEDPAAKAAGQRVGLTAEQRHTFWQLGYLPLGQVAEPQVVTTLLLALARLTDTSRPDRIPETYVIRSASDGQIRVGLHLCHLDDAFRSFALHPGIAAAMRTLFGCKVAVLTSLLFDKPPGTGHELTAHQDLPYYPYLGPDDLITCWTALDPVGVDGGQLEYVPGSHRAVVPHRRTGGEQSLDIAPELVGRFAGQEGVLPSGAAVAHHGLTVHRSRANTSGRPRRGLATLYVRADSGVTLANFPHAPLVPMPATG